MKTVYIYIIQAYNDKAGVFDLVDACEIQLIGDTSDLADEMIKKAQDMIAKKYYRINKIIEKPEVELWQKSPAA